MSDDTRERLSHAARDGSAPPNASDGNQTMFQPDGHLEAEMVSAWLDTPDDFSEQDRLAIERHLATCVECQTIAAELTAIVRAFQTMQLVETPHSFALTPEMAGLTATPTLPSSRRLDEPAHPHERQMDRQPSVPVVSYARARRFERQMSTLRWATAVATLLFVFFISVDVLGNIDSGGDDDDSAAFTSGAQSQQTEMAPLSASGAEATATTGSSGASVQATTVPEDTARNSAPEPTSASAEDAAGGGEPDATAASGESQALTTDETAQEDDFDEEAPPASAGAEATPGTEATAEDATTMSQVAPTESVQGYAADQDNSESTLSSQNVVEADQESSTLHLIELALVITIAWLIVALIALPRLRRPAG